MPPRGRRAAGALGPSCCMRSRALTLSSALLPTCFDLRRWGNLLPVIEVREQGGAARSAVLIRCGLPVYETLEEALAG